MYEIPNITEYIYDIRTIFKNIDRTDSVSTRRNVASNNCRSSQIKLPLFYLYLLHRNLADDFFDIFNLNERERTQKDMSFLQKVYFNVKDIFVRLSRDNRFIKKTYNVNNPEEVLKLENISDLDTHPSIDFYGIRFWPLCVYWEGRGIIHYFSLIEQSGNFFIFNSYGSDYVCIQPYIVPIELSIFNDFIQSDENDSDIDDFIKTYFISREAGLDVEAIDETLDLRGKKSRMVDREKGEQAELGIFKKRDWSVGYIPLFDVLDDPSIYIAFGKRKTKRTKRTKRKNIKLYRSKFI